MTENRHQNASTYESTYNNSSRRSNAQSNRQNMFQSHQRNEQILQKTEKCWKETTQKRLDSEKVQHNHVLGDSINHLDLK